MIYDYGLEPELVASWGEVHAYRFFFDKFGLGTPRAVSRYPEDWKARVVAAASSAREVERTRVDELVQMISENAINRETSPYDAASAWLENAEQEHVDRPFDMILASSNPRSHADILVGSAIFPGCDPRWDLKSSLSPVARSPADMSAAVAPMLKNCTVAHLIDPNFGPENPRHRRPAEAFFAAVLANRRGRLLTHIEIHTSDKSTPDFFRKTCQEQLPRVIPGGLKVMFRRWRQKDGGEIFHDRFILTDLGGVEFSVGLDEGREGQHTGVRLLGREEYLFWWRQYFGEPPAFDPAEPDPFPVTGTRRGRSVGSQGMAGTSR
ncbi:MAG: hypothetical protein ABSA52_09510 [Candidatus Binatia bacterium]|jgi:hypothetical protein